MGLLNDIGNAAGAAANALNNPNAQNTQNATQAAIDAMKAATVVGGNIANNLSQNGGAIVPPNPATLAALGSAFVQATQTVINSGADPLQALSAGIKVATAVTTANFNAIDGALKNLDATVPGSIDTLKQSTAAIDSIAKDPLASSIVAALGGNDLATHIGSLGGNLTDLSVQYDNYNSASNIFTQSAAKFAVGHNARQAQNDVVDILGDLKKLGL